MKKACRILKLSRIRTMNRNGIMQKKTDAPPRSRREKPEREIKMKEAQEMFGLIETASDMLRCGASDRDFEEIRELMEAIADLADISKDREKRTANTALIAISATARRAINILEETSVIVRGAADAIDDAMKEPEAEQGEQNG